MIYKKHGKFWTMDFVYRGVRYQRSAKLENRRDAEEYERAFRTKVSKGEVGLPDPNAPQPERKNVAQLLESLERKFLRNS
jgi:hypothetical protein